METSNDKNRVIAFGVANLVIAAFNVVHLLYPLFTVPVLIADTSGVYRGSPHETVMWVILGVYGFMAVLGTTLPAVAGVLLLMRKRIGYLAHLLAIIPGGLLFFPPFGLAYIPIAFLYGRGAAMRAGFKPGT